MCKECISIVVPCYNEEQVIPLFCEKIQLTLESMSEKYNLVWECIFVDDGSTDKTIYIIKEFCKINPNFKYIELSRNFGKEAAMNAGLKRASGEYAAIMDVDLQDPPEMLEEMYLSIKESGYDSCAARRVTRYGEPKIRSFFADCFYKLMNKISKTEIVSGARDFRLMNRKMVDAVLSLCEYNRFSKGIFGWVGFNTKWLEYENQGRAAGNTKWSFWKLLLYSLDGIIAFSTIPLSISSIVGLFFCIISFIMIIVFTVKTLIWKDPVAGYPSLVCIIFFISGIQLFCLGIIGQYISKAYLEVKKRPIYIEKDTNILSVNNSIKE